MSIFSHLSLSNFLYSLVSEHFAKSMLTDFNIEGVKEKYRPDSYGKIHGMLSLPANNKKREHSGRKNALSQSEYSY